MEGPPSQLVPIGDSRWGKHTARERGTFSAPKNCALHPTEPCGYNCGYARKETTENLDLMNSRSDNGGDGGIRTLDTAFDRITV